MVEATVEAVVEVDKGAATKLRGDDATGATGANASVEVANRQIAERMATILFMVIVVLREDDTLVGKVMVWADYYDIDLDIRTAIKFGRYDHYWLDQCQIGRSANCRIGSCYDLVR